MPGKQASASDKRLQAREVAEWSLEKLEEGDERDAKKLARKAAEIDADTAREVLEEEMDEEIAKDEKKGR